MIYGSSVDGENLPDNKGSLKIILQVPHSSEARPGSNVNRKTEPPLQERLP